MLIRICLATAANMMSGAVQGKQARMQWMRAVDKRRVLCRGTNNYN
jgi:hypothetical protein